ncbi:MAG: hypothetical protein ACOCRL_01320 [Bacillota bacterium]
MDDFIGAIFWVIIIISGIAKFIGKSVSDENKEKFGEIKKKINEIISPEQDNESNKTAQADSMSLQKENSDDDDEWIPAYEEKYLDTEKNESRGSSTELIKHNLEKKLSEKREKLYNIEVDDEITIRDGVTIDKGEIRINGISESRKKKKRDVYDQQNKKSDLTADLNFSDDDIIKGIIFKEILDEPRSKRPYFYNKK